MYCSECRFWSEMFAKSIGDSIQAMCICSGGPMFMKYTLGRHGCHIGLSGYLGAIDAPGNENAYDIYPKKEKP